MKFFMPTSVTFHGNCVVDSPIPFYKICKSLNFPPSIKISINLICLLKSFVTYHISMNLTSFLKIFSQFKSVQILYTCSKFLSLVTLIRTCCRAQCKAAFDSWKDSKYPDDNESHNIYRSKRKDYRSRLRCFLNQVETDKIKKL